MFEFFKKTKQDSSKKDYYLGLLLKEEEGIAMILEAESDSSSIKKLDELKFKYSDSWEKIVEDVDEVLYKLESAHAIHIDKLIYFLYSFLVDQNTHEIKKPYKTKLGLVSKELELKLLGFIELHEGISIYLKRKEESPLTSIIIELGKASISLFIYKSGESVFSETGARTEDVTEDIKSIFSHISGKLILPSRIILYDSDKLEEESERVINHKWDENLFIQIPRVEIISDEEINEAILQSVGHQIFNYDEKISSKKDIEARVDNVMGFMIGEDVKDTEEVGDVEEKKPKSKRHFEKKARAEETVVEEIIEETDLKTKEFEESKAEGTPLKNKIMGAVGLLSDQLNKVKNAVAKSVLKVGARPKLTFIAVAGIFLITLAIFAVLYFFHNATITVFFEGKKEDKKFEVEGILNKPSDKKRLEIVKLEESVSTSESVDTTGKKTIGEKAKGEVTIHNWEGAEKTFKKGILMSSSSGIKFILDNEVKVASASEIQVGVKQTGKAKASTTAVELGTEGNIDKNQKLKIEDFSTNSYFASPNESFTGGSKKDVRTVSKEDLKKVKDNAIKKMKTEESKISKSKLSGRKVINQLTSIDLTKEKYSKEVGEEGKTLTLNASGKLVFYAYDDKDLKIIIVEAFSSIVPKDYEISTKNVSFRISDARKKDKDIIITVEAIVLSLQKVEKDNILNDIAGKDTKDIERLIKEKYKGRGFDAHIDSPIPPLNSRMPYFKKNINFKIEAL